MTRYSCLSLLFNSFVKQNNNFSQILFTRTKEKFAIDWLAFCTRTIKRKFVAIHEHTFACILHILVSGKFFFPHEPCMPKAIPTFLPVHGASLTHTRVWKVWSMQARRKYISKTHFILFFVETNKAACSTYIIIFINRKDKCCFCRWTKRDDTYDTLYCAHEWHIVVIIISLLLKMSFSSFCASPKRKCVCSMQFCQATFSIILLTFQTQMQITWWKFSVLNHVHAALYSTTTQSSVSELNVEQKK